MYDVVILGGGTSGCACAYMAAKAGLKTLLIEKNIHLGGTMTSGDVVPMMKTETQNLNCKFMEVLIEQMQRYKGQITYSDGNKAWFNPELLKIVLDDLLLSVNCELLFDCDIKNVFFEKNFINKIEISHKKLSSYIEAKYFIDATGDANLATLLNCQNIYDTNKQAVTLRFRISGIDLEAFKNQIIELDKNRNVTNFAYINNQLHLTTAYTWDNKEWGLKPIFDKAVNNGDLELKDTAYFQVFTIAGMPNTLSFNCPRIILEKQIDPLNPWDISNALILGRKQIWRIFNFCQKYFSGFEKAYIANISDMLGIRESRRIEGEYIFSEDDIISPKNHTPILYSNYPIDIHSDKKNNSHLDFVNHSYSLPIEVLRNKEYKNLYVIGRSLSATFKAQAALRIQPTCFSMGEAVASDIVERIKTK